ncbi:hypothetical protein OMR07_25565 [Methylobacterium organophilum]|nr:hypothetical protein [Methylobacterium organophilum]
MARRILITGASIAGNTAACFIASALRELVTRRPRARALRLRSLSLLARFTAAASTAAFRRVPVLSVAARAPDGSALPRSSRRCRREICRARSRLSRRRATSSAKPPSSASASLG